LADRIGQRVVLGASLAAAIPSLLLFAAFPGNQSLLFGPLFGFWSDMGLSITLVIAQRLLPGRVGVASGFILGMGFVTGGIGVPVTGVLADHVGVSHALMLTTSLIVAAALLVTRIPLAALQPAQAQSELALETAN
jgi:FSR family fosmidomycin resistance protein-like MFS transporter